MPLTVSVHRRCIGSGNCTVIAPEVFEMDAFGRAHLRPDAPAELPEEHVLEAARECPVEAIIVARDGRRLFPE